MGIETGISWTDHTFNIAWGCHKVSPACTFCYAEVWAKRMGHDVWGLNNGRLTFGVKHWNQPIKWNKLALKEGKRKRVFCSSMCDVFEDHPAIIHELTKLWPLIKATPMLDWQLLTNQFIQWPQSGFIADKTNLGRNCSQIVGTRHTIVVFDGCAEPDVFVAVAPISRQTFFDSLRTDLTNLHWIIYGGESGPHRRPENLQWARDINARCANTDVAFYFKQSSGLKSGTNPHLDGVTHHNFPLEIING